MRRTIVALAFSMIASSSAYASCKSDAANLTGSAKTAFLKKCEAAVRAAKPRAATPTAAGGDDYSMKHKYRSMPVDER